MSGETKVMFVLAFIAVIICFRGCYLYPKRKALLYWAISYPLAFYLLFYAFGNIFG